MVHLTFIGVFGLLLFLGRLVFIQRSYVQLHEHRSRYSNELLLFFSIFVSLVVFMANCKEFILRIAHIRTKCIQMKKIQTKNKYQFDCHESNFDWIGSAKRYWGWQMFMCLTKIDFKLISYKWNENNACSSVQW